MAKLFKLAVQKLTLPESEGSQTFGKNAQSFVTQLEAELKAVEDSFDGGRQAMNAFFAEVNKGVGAKRLEAVPKGGTKGGYKRSEKLHAPPETLALRHTPDPICHTCPLAPVGRHETENSTSTSQCMSPAYVSLVVNGIP